MKTDINQMIDNLNETTFQNALGTEPIVTEFLYRAIVVQSLGIESW